MRPLIALVNPNQARPAVGPIAFDYLHGPLTKAGFRVEILDLCLEPSPEDAVGSYCATRSPRYWGVTLRNLDDTYYASRTWLAADAKKAVAWIRKHSDAPIVLGGAGFSIAPAALLNNLGADFGIICEGETAFPALLLGLENRQPVEDLPGLVHRRNGLIQVNPVRSFTTPGARSPSCRPVVDNREYYRRGGMAGIETKRGCNRRCIYCVEPMIKGRRVRFRPVGELVDEMQELLAAGVDAFHINDSEFNLSIRHSVAFCDEIIRRGLENKLSWYAYGMPAPLPERLVQRMVAAGCAGLNLGTDSASPTMLRRLRRTFSQSDIAAAVATCKNAGLDHLIELLLGGPGETRETVQESIGFLRAIDVRRASLTLGLRVFPGTELESIVRLEGLSADNPNLRGCIHDNAELLQPLYYVSAALGESPERFIADVVGDDPRFFGVNRRDFSYADNDLLVESIAFGERGAYWDHPRRCG